LIRRLLLALSVLFAPLVALAHPDAEIVMVVDRSGSMAATLDDAQGGVNQFIHDQKKLRGDVRFTLVQFDTDYEVLASRAPVSEVKDYTLVPRGNTALLDAVGRALYESEASDARLRVLVIVTDGLENSSHEHSLAEIKRKIAERKADGWQVVYIGRDFDVVAEASSIGIDGSPGTFMVDTSATTLTSGLTTVSDAIATAAVSGTDTLTLETDIARTCDADDEDCSE